MLAASIIREMSAFTWIEGPEPLNTAKTSLPIEVYYVRLQVLTTAIMKMAAFWVVAPCSTVKLTDVSGRSPWWRSPQAPLKHWYKLLPDYTAQQPWRLLPSRLKFILWSHFFVTFLLLRPALGNKVPLLTFPLTGQLYQIMRLAVEENVNDCNCSGPKRRRWHSTKEGIRHNT
jgi:hypothetical protein